MSGNPYYIPNYNDYEYQPTVYEDDYWIKPDEKLWLTNSLAGRAFRATVPVAYSVLAMGRPALITAHIGNTLIQTALDYKKERARRIAAEAEEKKAKERAAETVDELENISRGRSRRSISHTPHNRRSPAQPQIEGPAVVREIEGSRLVEEVEEPQVTEDNIADEPVDPKDKEPEHRPAEHIPIIDFKTVPERRILRRGTKSDKAMEEAANLIDESIETYGWNFTKNNPVAKKRPAYDLFFTPGAFEKAFKDSSMYIPKVMSKYVSPRVQASLSEKPQIVDRETLIQSRRWNRREAQTQEYWDNETKQLYKQIPTRK